MPKERKVLIGRMLISFLKVMQQFLVERLITEIMIRVGCLLTPFLKWHMALHPKQWNLHTMISVCQELQKDLVSVKIKIAFTTGAPNGQICGTRMLKMKVSVVL